MSFLLENINSEQCFFRMFCIDHEFGLLGAEFITEVTMRSSFTSCQTEISVKNLAKIQRP